jgi:hypothetical protein
MCTVLCGLPPHPTPRKEERWLRLVYCKYKSNLASGFGPVDTAAVTAWEIIPSMRFTPPLPRPQFMAQLGQDEMRALQMSYCQMI